MVGVEVSTRSSADATARPEHDPTPRFPHTPALDGLRGIAVLAVLAFHAGHLRGGYLGVDLFFVLSGFLITGLLVLEWHAHGAISLRRFWSRRAKRLLPPLLALVALTGAAAALLPDLAVSGLRGDALATLSYVSNWHFISAGNGYWDAFSASPFEHTWSLAIEAQFYVLWPLLVLGALRLAGIRALVALTAALAVASAGAMVVMFDPASDPSRLYFGTDTRAASILAGALLALVTTGHLWRRSSRRAARAAGEVGFVVFVALVLFVEGTSPFLYRGGFILSALSSTAIIASVASSANGPLKSLLSAKPLQLVGRVSYGLYLWHWPVYLVVDAEFLGAGGLALTAVRLALTAAITAASYVWLEVPIRRGTLRARRPFVLVPAAVALALASVLVVPVPAGEPEAAAGVTETSPEGPRILVVGDELAGAIGDALDAAGGFTVVRAVIHGCTPVRAQAFRESEQAAPSTSCTATHERWGARAKEARPDAVIVAFGWTGSGHHYYDGRWDHPCTARFDLHYEGEMEALLSQVVPQGTPVLVSTLPISTDASAPSDFERADCVVSAYRRVAASRSLGTVLDIASPLCRSGCRPGDGGVVLSGAHLSLDALGVRVLEQWAPSKVVSFVDAVEDATGAPVEMLLFGDSTALKFAGAFTADATGGAASLRSHATTACGITPGAAYAGRPLEKPACASWPFEWTQAIARTRPDVVLVMVGAWEVFDHQVDGRIVRFGEPDWERVVREGATAAAEVAATAEAPVVFLNAPCFRDSQAPFGLTSDRNDLRRVRAFNAVLADVARKTGAVVVDLEAFLCPDGRYEHEREGVVLRQDGVHLTPAGGGLVWSWLAPQVLDLAMRERDTAASTATPASTTIATSAGTRNRTSP